MRMSTSRGAEEAVEVTGAVTGALAETTRTGLAASRTGDLLVTTKETENKNTLKMRLCQETEAVVVGTEAVKEVIEAVIVHEGKAPEVATEAEGTITEEATVPVGTVAEMAKEAGLSGPSPITQHPINKLIRIKTLFKPTSKNPSANARRKKKISLRSVKTASVEPSAKLTSSSTRTSSVNTNRSLRTMKTSSTRRTSEVASSNH